MNLQTILSRHLDLVPLNEAHIDSRYSNLLRPLLSSAAHPTARCTKQRSDSAQVNCIRIQQDTPHGTQLWSAKIVIFPCDGSADVLLGIDEEMDGIPVPTIATIDPHTIRTVVVVGPAKISLSTQDKTVADE